MKVPDVQGQQNPCQPNFILEYQGIPLGYGEAKSNKFDTKGGLSYTSVCTASILNFAYPGQPGLVMHSNNRRFQIQSVKYNMDDGELVVKERLGTPYTLILDEDDYQCQHHRDAPIQNVVISQEIVKGMQLEERDAYALSGNMPLLYMYERFPISKVGVEVQALDPRHGYLQFHMEIANLLEAERRQSCDQCFNVRDYYHTDVPVEARSYNPMNVYFHPYYPNHYLWTSIEFADGHTADTWNGMNTTLRHFLHAVFEAVDVVTGVLLEQVPEDFKRLHRVSIYNGYLKLPHVYPRRLYAKKDKEKRRREQNRRVRLRGRNQVKEFRRKRRKGKKILIWSFKKNSCTIT